MQHFHQILLKDCETDSAIFIHVIYMLVDPHTS